MHSRAIPVIAAFLVIAGEASAQSLETQTGLARPVVVELFTSQGCSICPRANEFLGELTARGDVMPLSLGVDHWDYRGWVDTYARPEFTARQRGYAIRLHNRRVYTPQMIIDGVDQASGAAPARVLAAIEARAAAMPGAPALNLTAVDGELRIRVGSSEARETEADVWLIAYAPGRREVRVAAGANRGRVLEVYNVVLSLERLGGWNGGPMAFVRPISASEARAVIVQEPDFGEILAAGRLDDTDAHLAP